MAPEQSEGKACDARTDIFALGLVLYEMATGKRLAQGETAKLDNLPERFAHLLERCLEREPENRWQSSRDLGMELEWAGKSRSGSHPEIARSPRRWLWVVGAVAGTGLVLAGVMFFQRAAQPQPPARLSLPIRGLTRPSLPIPSPDGTNLLFAGRDAAGKHSLWVQPLNSNSARKLPGTEDAVAPFWRTDGRWIGFYSRGKLWKINPEGGSPQTLLALKDRPNGVAWSASGDIIFPTDNRTGLYRARESSGAIEPLTKLDLSRTENSHRYMRFLPDGRRFLFIARTGRRENNALYLGSLDSGEPHRVMTVQSNVSYVAPGDGRQAALLYVRDGTLVEHEFDGQNVIGDPVAIVENVHYVAASAFAEFAASSDGSVLVFAPANPGPEQPVWFDRAGHALGTLGPPGRYGQPRLSPDGTRLLYVRPDEQTGNRDVWYIESARGVAQRLTTDPANDWNPVWSPDGRNILFGTDRAGGPKHAIYIKNSTDPGAGEARFFDFGDADYIPVDWARTGDWVAFAVWTGPNHDAWILPPSGERVPFAFLATPFNEHSPRFSPDAKWIAYVSDESGRSEVYARRFSGKPAGSDGKIQVSPNGGDFPAWRGDGSELFYIGGDLKVYSVKTADLAPGGMVPRPVALFTACPDTALPTGPLQNAPWYHPYDVSSDGRRFLFVCSTGRPDGHEVMLNWRVRNK